MSILLSFPILPAVPLSVRERPLRQEFLTAESRYRVGSRRPLIVAHRGGMFWKGDDFSYISESVHEGAAVIELDVRQLPTGEYVVQHDRFSGIQGHLDDALARVNGVSLYLDLKGSSIDVQHLIDHVRRRTASHLIVGSFHGSQLRQITQPGVERVYHCFWPWQAIPGGLRSGADWISPLCYFTTESLANQIRAAGFKFAPSGNYFPRRHEFFANQLRYVRWGACAISTYHVRLMKKLLDSRR